MPLTLVLAAGLVLADEVRTRAEVLRLGDVADLAALPADLRPAAAGLALARLRRGAPQVTIPHAFLAAQARARLPALAAWLPAGGQSGALVVRRPLAPLQPVVEHGRGPVSRGSLVTVTVRSGPVTIRREGRALGDARAGEGVFVRTGDGAVVAAIYQEGER